MQLVPCRWQKSGWKYVEEDPGATRFFNSPHRVYSLGTSSYDCIPQVGGSKVKQDRKATIDDRNRDDTLKNTTYKSTFKK